MRIILVALVAVIAAASDQIPSGPKVGEKMLPFKVLAFSGPDAGKEVEWLADKKDRPTVIVFVHEITRPALKVLRQVEEYVAPLADDGPQTRYVWLTADKAKTEQFLNNAKNSLNLQAPVGISLDGADGPEKYGLNSMVKLTILVADKGRVVANFALVDPNEKDGPLVTAAIGKILKKKPAEGK